MIVRSGQMVRVHHAEPLAGVPFTRGTGPFRPPIKLRNSSVVRTAGPTGGFWGFCELCGTGDGIVTCPVCEGRGKLVTKPGGAGTRFLVGLARCKACSGQGKIPCMLCAGTEVRLPSPQPFRSSEPTLVNDGEDLEFVGEHQLQRGLDQLQSGTDREGDGT